MSSDTIFALATPEGVSGVAIIRLSGSTAFQVASNIGLKFTENCRSPLLARLKNPRNKELIDEVLGLGFWAPRSFTGEDVVEIQCHGSRAVIRGLADVLVDQGCRPANPGEFSRRALTNGKMDLVEVEALDQLIHAEDQARLELANGQSGVAKNAAFEYWRDVLTSLQAACEAMIDFPEDDLPEELVLQNQKRLRDLSEQAVQLRARTERAKILDKGLEVLLVGPPNAGKSTLLNKIAGYERAIVSSIPGTTRDFVELVVALGRFNIRFVDTAGLRTSADEIESMGIQRTEQRLVSAALILNLYEAGTKPLDLASGGEVWNLRTKQYAQDVFSVDSNAPENSGVFELLAAIESHFESFFASCLSELTFHSDRQMFHVKQFEASLLEALDADMLPELQAECLRRAATAIAHLSGAIHTEDVLNELFAGFCIGK